MISQLLESRLAISLFSYILNSGITCDRRGFHADIWNIYIFLYQWPLLIKLENIYCRTLRHLESQFLFGLSKLAKIHINFVFILILFSYLETVIQLFQQCALEIIIFLFKLFTIIDSILLYLCIIIHFYVHFVIIHTHKFHIPTLH